MSIRKYRRFWAVYDAGGGLICVTVYKKGAPWRSSDVSKAKTTHNRLAGPAGSARFSFLI